MALIDYFGGLYQLGYVTKDMDRATAFLQKKLGAGPFTVNQFELAGDFRGKKRDLAIRVAQGNVGAHQIEVIQPISGAVDHYLDGVDYERSVVTFHHVALVVPGPYAAWTDMLRQVRAGGDEFTIILEATENPAFQVCFAYVDTRPHLGHYTEYLWWSVGAETGNKHVANLSAS